MHCFEDLMSSPSNSHRHSFPKQKLDIATIDVKFYSPLCSFLACSSRITVPARRKPAVCFVLQVLYPELLKCVWHFLFQVYDYELDQHIIKPSHLANLPLTRVAFREGNMSSM